MADFRKALEKVARVEGGYQNHPNDAGNYNSRDELVGTNWGISAPVYEQWIDEPPTEADMRDMKKEEAEAIYKTLFWDRILGDDIADQDVAEIFFDGYVNHGRTGIRIMQRVLGVVPDGIVGPLTLGAINAASAVQLFNAYVGARLLFYHRLVASRPRLGVFLKGWMNRLATFA